MLLLIARVVDPSICKVHDPSFTTAYDILTDMASKGGLVAASRRSELEYLDMTLQRLNVSDLQEFTLDRPDDRSNPRFDSWDGTTHSGSVNSSSMFADEWGIENILNGEQLEAVADSLDFGSLGWFADLSQVNEMNY